MRLRAWGASIGLLLLCSGCNSELRTIEGDVTFNGKPVAQGNIEFVPVEGTGGPATGATISEGHYVLSTPASLHEGGRYQVRVTALEKTGKTTANVFDPDGPPLELSENYIPEHYNSASELAIEFSTAKCPYDFSLEGKQD